MGATGILECCRPCPARGRERPHTWPNNELLPTPSSVLAPGLAFSAGVAEPGRSTTTLTARCRMTWWFPRDRPEGAADDSPGQGAEAADVPPPWVSRPPHPRTLKGCQRSRDGRTPRDWSAGSAFRPRSLRPYRARGHSLAETQGNLRPDRSLPWAVFGRPVGASASRTNCCCQRRVGVAFETEALGAPWQTLVVRPRTAHDLLPDGHPRAARDSLRDHL